MRGCETGITIASHSKNWQMKVRNEARYSGVLLTTLIAATPTAFAQQSSGRASDQQMQDKSSKRAPMRESEERPWVLARYTGSDNASVPGASFRQDDTQVSSRCNNETAPGRHQMASPAKC
jgi:hypothetical protein